MPSHDALDPVPMLPSAAHGNNATPAAHVDALARFVCETRAEDIPDAAIARCKLVIADCIAVVAAGMQSAEMRSLRTRYLASAGPGTSSVIGAGRTAAASDAGFLNGIAATWHDFDEGHTMAHGHPGTYVIPAALAKAQELQCSGQDLLAAACLGYEACARVGAATQMRVAVHPHGTYGVIGAATAVARLKGIPLATMRHVINIAATMAMATNRQAMLDEATVRNVYTGHTALAGQIAVQLAEAGFTGQRDGIGFTFGTVIADGFDPEVAMAGLGTDWLVPGGYFKLHPAGRYAHAAIDALEDALAKLPGPVAVDAVDRIEVRAFRLASLLSGKRVSTSFGAKFSIPFALATLIHHGRSNLEAFDDAAVAHPGIARLASRVEVVEDPTFTALYPGRHRIDLVLFMTDGSRVEGRCDIMKGDPANPHRPEDVRRKFFELTAPIWGDAGADAIYDACLNLEDRSALQALTHALATLPRATG